MEKLRLKEIKLFTLYQSGSQEENNGQMKLKKPEESLIKGLFAKP